MSAVKDNILGQKQIHSIEEHFIDESTNAHVKQIVIVELALTIHLSWAFLTTLINKTHTIQFYWT